MAGDSGSREPAAGGPIERRPPIPVFLRVPEIEVPHSRRKGWIEVDSWNQASRIGDPSEAHGVEFDFRMAFGKVATDLYRRSLRDRRLGDVRVSVETTRQPWLRFTLTRASVVDVAFTPNGEARFRLHSPQQRSERDLWDLTYVYERKRAG